ncbi:MAG: hypothetical protein K6F69_06515 [Treponema sp.]|nr:hypothetical protein [Treponema sp.]
MGNPKRLIYAAGVGFILSFIVGLFASIEFVHIIIRAIICAALFAGVAFACQSIFYKYLDEPSDSGEVISSAPKVGGIVDLTLDGEKLSEDTNAPRFNVGSNLKDLSTIDVKDSNNNSGAAVANDKQETSSTSDSASSFKPMGVVNVAASSSTSAASNADNANDNNVKQNQNTVSDSMPISSNSQSSNNQNVSLDTIDELPDIGDLDSEGDSASFSSGTTTSTSSMSVPADKKSEVSFPDGSNPSVKDAALIAQAISTVLAKDD